MATRWRCPPGEPRPALADAGLVACRQRCDEVMDECHSGRSSHLGVVAVGTSVRDIVPDRVVEKERFLRDQGDLPAQGREGDRPDVRAVNRDPACGRIVESGNQAGQRTLAGPTGPHQRQDLAADELQVDLTEHGNVTLPVSERDVPEGNGASEGVEIDGPRAHPSRRPETSAYRRSDWTKRTPVGSEGACGRVF